MNPKKFILLIFVSTALMVTNLCYAYMQDVEILSKEEVVKLSDDKLMETYVDVLVEMEASKTFHATSGFNPKSYTAYKDLLRYRIQLLMEIHKRGLEAPSVE